MFFSGLDSQHVNWCSHFFAIRSCGGGGVKELSQMQWWRYPFFHFFVIRSYWVEELRSYGVEELWS